MEGGRVIRVTGDVKFASICGNKGISAHKPLCGEEEVKLPEDILESFREEFSPLFYEGRRGGNFIRQEIEILQQFMADAAASHAEEEMDDP